MQLLLFDVDLTLVNSGGAGRRAMTRAFEDVFGKRNGLDKVSFAGRTDRAILREAMLLNGLKWTSLSEDDFKQAYLRYLEIEIEKPKPAKHIEPGVPQLLEVLSNRSNITVGLLTGNWRGGAGIKLKHFNLLHYFRLGAFADDSEDRNELAQFAVQRFEESAGRKIQPQEVYVVGDTPRDVACARAFGAKCVSVATGLFSFAELEASRPDYLFRDLSNTQDFLEILDGRA